MPEGEFYNLFSYLAALLSIVSAFVALRAMRKGLTYSTLRGTVFLLLCVAVGRIFHSIRETYMLSAWAEILEYSFYIAGNVYFVILALRVRKLPAALSSDLVEHPMPQEKK